MVDRLAMREPECARRRPYGPVSPWSVAERGQAEGGPSVARGSFLRLAALAVLWGSSFLWIAIALRGLAPIQIVLVRLIVGTVLLLGITSARKLRLPTDRGLWLRLAIAAVFGNVIPYTLFAIAEQRVDSSVAGVLNATTPLWTILIGFTVGTDRKVSGEKLAGFVIGFLGTLVIFTPWESGSQIASWGGLAALMAGASYGVGYVYMGHQLAGKGLGPIVLSAGQLVAATCILVVIAPFLGGFQVVHMRWDALLAVVMLGALATGMAYLLNYRLIADEGTTASVVTYLLPIVAVVLGAVVLGEPLTVSVLSGMVIVLAGVALTQRAA